MWISKWVILGVIYFISRNKIKTAKNPYLVCLGIFIGFISSVAVLGVFATVIVNLGTELKIEQLVAIGELIASLASFNVYYNAALTIN